jgi:hypothetical protein
MVSLRAFGGSGDKRSGVKEEIARRYWKRLHGVKKSLEIRDE